MFERSFELFLRILKWFSFLLGVTCIIFVRAIYRDVWQAMEARHRVSEKTVISLLSI